MKCLSILETFYVSLFYAIVAMYQQFLFVRE